MSAKPPHFEEFSRGSGSEWDPAQLLGFVADLAKQADGDAFTLFSVLAESADGVPDDVIRCISWTSNVKNANATVSDFALLSVSQSPISDAAEERKVWASLLTVVCSRQGNSAH